MSHERNTKILMLAFIAFVTSWIAIGVFMNWQFQFMGFFGWTGIVMVSGYIAFGIAVATGSIASRPEREVYPSHRTTVVEQSGHDFSASLVVAVFYAILTVILVAVWQQMPQGRSVVMTTYAIAIVGPLVLRFIRGSLADAEKEAMTALNQRTTPSKRSAKKLFRGEQLKRETRKHPVVLARAGLLLIVLIAVARRLGVSVDDSHGDTAPKIIVYAWLAAMLYIAWLVIRWYQDMICITDQRILEVVGVFTTSVKMMPSSKMTDAIFTIPWHSTLLSGLRIIRLPYGTFVLESAGQKQALEKIEWVPDATAVYNMLMGKTFK